MAPRFKPNGKVLETLLPVLEKEGWSYAQIAEDWGISLATLEGHLAEEGRVYLPGKSLPSAHPWDTPAHQPRKTGSSGLS